MAIKTLPAVHDEEHRRRLLGEARRPAAVAAAALLAGLLAVLGWRAGRGGGEAPAESQGEQVTAPADDFPTFRFRLLSRGATSHRQPSLSPDGNLVAFATEDDDGVSQIWIVDVAGGEPVQITSGGPAASRPHWSGAGDRILFQRDGQGIWEVPPLGGAPRQLVPRGTAPALTPDGQRLVFVDRDRPWLADGDGGGASPHPGFETQYFGSFARSSFSPDGSQLATFRPDPNRPLGDLVVVPVDGSAPPRQLTRLGFLSWGGRPVWSGDGRWLLFSSDHGGAVNIWRVPAAGGEPLSVTTGAGGDYDPAISRDGRRLVYANGRQTATLELFEPATGAHRTVYERRDLLIGPTLSPDGREVAYFARVPHAFHVLVAELSSGSTRQVTHGRGVLNSHPRWSADGRWIYFYQELPSPSLRRVPAAGGPEEVVVDGWRWTEENAVALAPDGGRVAYSVRESGRLLAARVRDLASGAERDLATPLRNPAWSPDGEWVYGHTAALEIERCPATGEPCATVTQGANVRLADGGRQLYFVRSNPEGTIWRRDLASGREEALHVLEDVDWVDFGYGILAGGAIVHHAQHAADLELWVGEAID